MRGKEMADARRGRKTAAAGRRTEGNMDMEKTMLMEKSAGR